MAGIGHGVGGVATLSTVVHVGRADVALPWATVSDPGPTRRNNEDRWSVDDAHGVFALADGMGGVNAGEVAAEIAVRTVAQGVGALHAAGLGLRDALIRAVAAAHAGIVDFAHTRPECLGMATTLGAAAIDGARLTIAHVGDSRAYLMRHGVLRRLTADHSIGQQMLDAGRLTEAQVRKLSARGILTRALGIETEPPEPDVGIHEWLDGDLLLLCSDGLTDALDDRQLGAILSAPDVSLAARARELIATALGHGCIDDATVLLAGGPRAVALSH